MPQLFLRGNEMRILLLIAMFLPTFLVQAQTIIDRKGDGELSLGKHYSYQSELMAETQKYTVVLPWSYEENPGQYYPMVFVAGGINSATMMVSTAFLGNYGWDTLAAEVIVVGLPSNKQFRDFTSVNSTLDTEGKSVEWLQATGGADKYRNFLKSEFFPHIENLYRTNGHRIIVGHSLAGHFALVDMLSGNPLFQSYIAIDPTLYFADGHLAKIAKKLNQNDLNSVESLYISTALKYNNPYDVPATEYRLTKGAKAEDFFNSLMENRSPSFRGKREAYGDETHGSVMPISLYQGVRHVFEGYAPPKPALVAQNPSLLTDHYKTFSKKTAANYLPETRAVSFSGWVALNKNLNDNAVELFQINTINYPYNSYAWFELGECYERLDRLEEALEAFSKAAELDPEDQATRQKVDELSK